MKNLHLDNLPSEVQNSIYSMFIAANLKEKLVFLSRLEYGHDISYQELSEIVGVTFQRIQNLYDTMIEDIKKSPYLLRCSGVYVCS